jgi:hypothetical protein
LAKFSEDFSRRGRCVTQGLGFQSCFLSVPPRPLRETNIVALAPQYAIVVAASPRCDLYELLFNLVIVVLLRGALSLQ